MVRPVRPADGKPLGQRRPVLPLPIPRRVRLANRVEHPLNVNLREDAVIGHVDQWLARELAPHSLSETIRDLAAAQQAGTITRASDDEETTRKIAECGRKLTQYRAALDAGASSETVAAWIAETEAEKARYQLAARPAPARTRMSEAEIKAVVDKLADIALVLRDADPDDKAEIFRQLGPKLTYHPGRQLVEAQVEVPRHWQMESVRDLNPERRAFSPILRLSTQVGEKSPVRGFHAAMVAGRFPKASSWLCELFAVQLPHPFRDGGLVHGAGETLRAAPRRCCGETRCSPMPRSPG